MNFVRDVANRMVAVVWTGVNIFLVEFVDEHIEKNLCNHVISSAIHEATSIDSCVDDSRVMRHRK